MSALAYLFRFLLLSFILICTLPKLAYSESISDVESNLTKQKTEIKKLKKQLASLNVKQDTANKALKETSKKVSKARKNLRTTQNKLQTTQNNLSLLREQNRKIKLKLNQSKRQIQQLLIAVYKNQNNNHLKLLLSNDNPQALSRLLKYHQYFQKNQIEQIQTHLDTLKEFKLNEKKLTDKLVNLQSLKKRQQEEQTQLDKSKQTQRSQLSKLRKSYKKAASRLKKREQDQKRLNTLLADMKKALEDINDIAGTRPFKSDKGKMPWPTKGRIKQSFGSSLAGGKLKSNGIVIASPTGRPVTAIHNGRVVFSDWLTGYGLLTIIDHGGGYMSLYGQAESVLLEPGEWVNRGDTIAYTGNTGDLDIEGIYFEIRKNGIPTNPKRWCTGRP
jgi:septal ring factor EnvC (AmiA/AmiB activator)